MLSFHFTLTVMPIGKGIRISRKSMTTGRGRSPSCTGVLRPSLSQWIYGSAILSCTTKCIMITLISRKNSSSHLYLLLYIFSFNHDDVFFLLEEIYSVLSVNVPFTLWDWNIDRMLSGNDISNGNWSKRT